jgi:hypothetical protein
MTIYTYVVDHGQQAPAITADTKVNGGKVQAVMFDDGLARLEALEELLTDIQRVSTEDKVHALIASFLNR